MMVKHPFTSKAMIHVATWLVGASVLLGASPANAAESEKIGVVNFKRAVENSRVGKHEQETFEALKTQMESILSEKEKEISELAKQVNDPDHLDSISPEAEEELNNKFRALSQEFGQVQNQYYQALQQANMKILQKLASAVGNASEQIALSKNLAFVLSEENCFYFSDHLDVTNEVISEMDRSWKEERQKLLQELKTNTPSEEEQE